MPSLPQKQQLKTELLRVLEQDLAVLERAQANSQRGATHEEAKQEDDKDTRAIEQAYLARGQALRVEELRAALADVKRMNVGDLEVSAPASLGALVTVDEDGSAHHLFLAQHAGGAMLAEGTVQVVTPKSPLGSAIVGARVGDDCQVFLPQRTRELTVLAVR